MVQWCGLWIFHQLFKSKHSSLLPSFLPSYLSIFLLSSPFLPPSPLSPLPPSLPLFLPFFTHQHILNICHVPDKKNVGPAFEDLRVKERRQVCKPHVYSSERTVTMKGTLRCPGSPVREHLFLPPVVGEILQIRWHLNKNKPFLSYKIHLMSLSKLGISFWGEKIRDLAFQMRKIYPFYLIL